MRYKQKKERELEMTYNKAKQMLTATIPHYRGIVAFEENGEVTNYGINIDGDGDGGRYFGNPKILWTVEAVNNLLNTNYALPKAERGEGF